MSNYTVRVYDILRFYNGNTDGGYEQIENAIKNHWQDVFDIDIWSTWDSTYKATLCQKILRHYLMYEIGAETVSLWKIQLNSRMSEIMPKYNIMYRNIEKAYSNFFADVDYKETTNRTQNETEQKDTTLHGTNTETNTTNGNSTQDVSASGDTKRDSTSDSTNTADSTTENTSTNTGTSSNGTDAWQTASDTPQGTLSDLETNTYLSNAVHNKGSADAKTETNADSTGKSNATTTANATATDTTETTSTTNTTATAKTEENKNQSSDQTQNDNTNRDTTENYVKTVIGKMGSQNNAVLFNDIVKNLINIDEMIINELKDCFLLLWE